MKLVICHWCGGSGCEDCEGTGMLPFDEPEPEPEETPSEYRYRVAMAKREARMEE